nr:MAG TPA: hypothetical protein [Caudoviricetes sp.]
MQYLYLSFLFRLKLFFYHCDTYKYIFHEKGYRFF